MTKYIILTFFLSFTFHYTFSQISFGPEFGIHYVSSYGFNDFDSIRVTPNGRNQEAFGGIFLEVGLTETIALHNKVLLRPNYLGYTVFNNEADCLPFCPVEKTNVVGVTNLSLEVLPKLRVVQVGTMNLNIFGGVNTSFNFTTQNEDIFFRGKNPGVAKVFNTLDEGIRPVTFGLVYGASLEINRFNVWVRYQGRSRYTHDITLDEHNQVFNKTWDFLSFSVGYRFYSLRWKKKEGE